MNIESWLREKVGVDVSGIDERQLVEYLALSYSETPIVVARIPSLGVRAIYCPTYDALLDPEVIGQPTLERLDKAIEKAQNGDILCSLLLCLPKEKALYQFPSLISHIDSFRENLKTAVHKAGVSGKVDLLTWLAISVLRHNDWNDQEVNEYLNGKQLDVPTIKANAAVYRDREIRLRYIRAMIIKEALIYG